VRCLVLTGTGGAGTTTVAAATAALAARRGRRVLLTSVVSTSALADVLDLPLPPGLGGRGSGGQDDPGGTGPWIEPAELAPGLFVAPFEPGRLARDRWPDARDRLGPLWEALAVPPLEAEELLDVPGLGELAALAALRAAACGTMPFDVVVLDAGPLTASLPLLALPAALAGYLRRLLPAESLLGRRRALALGGFRFGLPPAADAVERLRGDGLAAMDELAGALTDPDRVAVRLVAGPGRLAWSASRRALRALALHGIAVDAVIANRPLGAGPELAAEPVDPLAELAELAAPPPVLSIPAARREPVGLAALAALGAAAYPDGDPTRCHTAGARTAGSGASDGGASDGGASDGGGAGPATAPVLARSGESFSLTLALPFTEPGEVELARLGDDRLALTVGADRRVLTLPSVLRRCEVDGAALRGDRLVISFVPDPALWPRTRSGLPA